MQIDKNMSTISSTDSQVTSWQYHRTQMERPGKPIVVYKYKVFKVTSERAETIEKQLRRETKY